jgi:hypothetical protein
MRNSEQLWKFGSPRFLATAPAAFGGFAASVAETVEASTLPTLGLASGDTTPRNKVKLPLGNAQGREHLVGHMVTSRSVLCSA